MRNDLHQNGAPACYARPNRFEINLDAVAACTQQIRRRLGEDVQFFATLKSNGYGYGVLPVAHTVLTSGADALSLASLEDAIALRKSGIRVPILVYAGVLPSREVLRAFQEYDLIPTVHNQVVFNEFLRFATKPLEVAVKVDLGSERIGVPFSAAEEFIRNVHSNPMFKVIVVNSHPNVRGGAHSREFLNKQYREMTSLRQSLADLSPQIKWFPIASSKVLRMMGASMRSNAADPGAALFDPLEPDEDSPHPFHALKSRIIEIRTVEEVPFPEEVVFDIRKGMRVGVLPVGYSDNIHRVNAGCVLVAGRRVPILEPASLEYVRIDLSGVPEALVGDEVVIVGQQGSERISPQEVMRVQGAARVVDLAMDVGQFIPRVYVSSADQA